MIETAHNSRPISYFESNQSHIHYGEIKQKERRESYS